MRKISIISLVAVLAATPMMAEAARTIQKTDNLTITANTNVASTSYVQGAYNAANTKINALIDDTAVAAKADGQPAYVAVSADSTVGENLAALDSKVKSLESATSANLSEAINSLTATVSQTTGDINISVAEQSGVLTDVSASINDGAVTTGKIANGTILVEDVATSALATNIADSATATDSKLATEKAVRTVVDSINSDASALAGRVTAAESAISDLESNTSFTASEVAANQYLTSTTDIAGNVVNVASAVETLTGNGEGSVAKAQSDAISAAQNYTDSKRLTVYTTWDNPAASSAIALSSAD